MKLNSDATDRRTRKLLVVAQLMTLAFFALGLAFTVHPTAGNLFLFTTLSPVLVPGAAVILATQWVAAYQRRQRRQVVVQRAGRAYRGANPVQLAG
jgi:membrane protein implicated in regulation of membrane protease activity